MPLYEFSCLQCRDSFEELVRNAEAVKKVACPSCGSRKVKKKMSTFAAKAGGSAAASTAAAACAPGGT